MVLIKKVVETSDKKIGNIIRGCTLVCLLQEQIRRSGCACAIARHPNASVLTLAFAFLSNREPPRKCATAGLTRSPRKLCFEVQQKELCVAPTMAPTVMVGEWIWPCLLLSDSWIIGSVLSGSTSYRTGTVRPPFPQLPGRRRASTS